MEPSASTIPIVATNEAISRQTSHAFDTIQIVKQVGRVETLPQAREGIRIAFDRELCTQPVERLPKWLVVGLCAATLDRSTLHRGVALIDFARSNQQ